MCSAPHTCAEPRLRKADSPAPSRRSPAHDRPHHPGGATVAVHRRTVEVLPSAAEGVHVGSDGGAVDEDAAEIRPYIVRDVTSGDGIVGDDPGVHGPVHGRDGVPADIYHRRGEPRCHDPHRTPGVGVGVHADVGPEPGMSSGCRMAGYLEAPVKGAMAMISALRHPAIPIYRQARYMDACARCP